MGVMVKSTSNKAHTSQAEEKEAEARRKAAAEKKAADARKKAAEAKEEREAAAKRVKEAFKKGGNEAAAQKLRRELASAKAEDRAGIMHEVKPILDQLGEDIGLNSRREEKDWKKTGRFSTDAGNKNPINTETEYQNTLQDVAASVQMAGDKEAAFHIAKKVLASMPEGKQSNTEKNLLGLFGDGLTAASADENPLLLNATTNTLVDASQKGPKGSELGRNIEQRNDAARLLDPTIDDHPAVVVEDWASEEGVKHDGTVWHEVSRNPDLFLTKEQRKSINEKYTGLSEAMVNEIKTDQAVMNMQGQHKGRDLNKVWDNEVFDYKNPDIDPGLKLDPDVKKAMDRSKTDHQSDRTYPKHLDKFAGTSGFGKLNKAEQIAAIEGYDRIISQAERSGTRLNVDQEGRLEDLLVSKSLHKLSPSAKARIEGMFSEYADSTSKLDNLQKLVDKSGLDGIKKSGHQMEILEAYQNDSAFEDAVNQLAKKGGLSAGTRTDGLGRLRAIKFAGQLYGDSSGEEQRTIMDNAVKMVTSKEFIQLGKEDKEAAMLALVKYGDEEYGLIPGGYKAALIHAGAMNEPVPDRTPGKISPLDEDRPPNMQVTSAKGPAKAADGLDGVKGTGQSEKETEAKDPTEQSVKADLKTMVDGAAKFAKDDKTINDPLRRDAKADPVNYAYTSLSQKHGKNKAYMKKLNGALEDFRRDYTTQEVKKLFEKKDFGGALKTLNSQMESVGTAKERNKLFESAGKSLFTKEFIRDKLDAALKEEEDGIESKSKSKAGELAALIGENAPAEVADLAVDVYIEELKKPASQLIVEERTDPLTVTQERNKQLYIGLSAMAGRADQHGAGRSKDLAKVLKDTTLPGELNDKAMMQAGYQQGPRVDEGLSGGVEDAVKNGDASLTIALINEYSNDSRVMGAKTNYDRGQEHADWLAQGYRETLIRKLDLGLKAFSTESKKVMESWQTSNTRALELRRSFGNSDPVKAMQAVAADREAHPSGEPGGDHYTTVDDKMELVYERGVKAYSLNQQLVGLKLDLEAKDAPEEVRNLKKSIEKFTSRDNDPVQFSMQPGSVGAEAVSLNPELQKHFEAQINFGVAQEGPKSPLEGVYEERDALMKWLNANESKLVPRAVGQNIRDDTDEWVTEVERIMLEHPKDAGAKITSATEKFEKKLAENLKGQEEQPKNSPKDIRYRILRDQESWQKGGVVVRLSRNCVEAMGEGMMATYAKRKMARVLANNAPNGMDLNVGMGNRAWRNIAHLTFADSTVIEGTMRNIEDFQRRVNAEVAALPDGETLSKSRIKELKKEFWANQPGARGVNPIDVGVPGHGNLGWCVARAIGIAAFGVGAPVLHEYGARKEGVQSDDLYAWAFTTGFITEAYRLGTGNNLGPQAVTLPDGTTKFTGLKWDWARKLSGLGPGTFLSVADTMWFMEDVEAGNTPNAIGTGVLVASDWVDIGAALTPLAMRTAATAGLISAETAAAISSSGWIPVIGWVASAGIVAGQVSRYATSLTQDKNQMEYENNPRYAKMVRHMGFTEQQAKEVTNYSGGPVPQFWKGGVNPMVALHAVFDKNPGADKQVPSPERLRYLQSLSPAQIKKLVEKCHELEDNEMSDQGTFKTEHLAGLKAWMKDNDLWKTTYLGR